ncbi:hypothetical protein EON64_05860 [archaeon]|nr:MAG: hypothetical protein EON64_05860 [archaeon]
MLITSATLEASKLQNFFWQCPLLNIPGRVFPVDIYHSKTKQVMTVNGPANNLYVQVRVRDGYRYGYGYGYGFMIWNQLSYYYSCPFQAAVDVVLKIHAKDEDGHILVFLTGQEEIERACALLQTHLKENPQDDRYGMGITLQFALPLSSTSAFHPHAHTHTYTHAHTQTHTHIHIVGS